MRSRSEWFLTPTLPSKSSSHPGEHDLFTMKTFAGSLSFANEDEKKLTDTADSVPLLPKKSFRKTPLVERFNMQTKKGRQPLLERTYSASSPKSNRSSAVSSSGAPSWCAVRRRSWRVRSLKGNLLELKTHSLDSPEPPLLAGQRAYSVKSMYSRPLAHSIGGRPGLWRQYPMRCGRRKEARRRSTSFVAKDVVCDSRVLIFLSPLSCYSPSDAHCCSQSTIIICL